MSKNNSFNSTQKYSGKLTIGNLNNTFKKCGSIGGYALTVLCIFFSLSAVCQPTITSFTPGSGPVGTSVIITGTNFTGATNVFVGAGVTNSTFTLNSATQITATIPTGAITGRISVVTPGFMATSSTNFTVTTASPPTINSFTPTSGPVGTSVIITGTNFTGATEVSFGFTLAASYTVNSATQITATIAPGTGTGQVRVTASGIVAVSSTNFTPTGQPTITSFTPASGPVGTTVIVTGTNFTGVTAVSFNNTPAASYTVNSTTQITAVVAAGTVTGSRVRVTASGYVVNSSGTFTVTSAATPTITSFTPASGPVGTSVTITGTNFTGATAVSFNNTAAAGFFVNSATQITATVATGTTTGAVRVTAAGTTAISAGNFTVTAPPATITSFTPSSGPVGTTIVITGTGFTGATNVFVGAGVTNSTFTLNSATQITATVAPGTSTGVVSVVIPGFMASSSTNFTVVAAPAITSIDFLTGPIGSFVTVTGSNLLGATAVMANGVAMAVSNNTASSVRLQVPTGGLSGPIQLSANGSTVITQFFTVTTAANVLQHIPGQTLTLTSATTAATYQWQVNTGSGFVNISNNANYSGATTYRLVVTGAPTSWTGYQYRVVAGGVNSTPQTLRFVHTSLGGNWNAAISWHLGQIPDQYGDIFFKPSSPVLNVNVNASCRSLTATTSNQVTVKSGITLTIHK